jgi:type I restriction enzyme, S subunit
MSFPRYPRYKDSGVEWLGEVPEHWEIRRLKQIAEVLPSNVDKKTHDGEAPVLLCNYTDVYYNEIIGADLPFMAASASEDQTRKLALRAGDTIITKDSESADDIAVAAYVPEDLPGVVCGYHLSVVRPRVSCIGAFIKRYFDSAFARSCVAVLANGLTRVGLTTYALNNLTIPVPPAAERLEISSFLDRETAKIDALIAEQQRLIELLKEKRQAVISRAVTRGLDPDAPMKPSGVDSLGDMPAHWTIAPLKRVASVRTGIAKGKDHGGRATVPVPYLRVANVQDGYLDLSAITTMEIPVNDLDRFKLQPGDVLMNEGGDFDKLGRGCVWEGQIEPCITQNHVFAVRPKAVSSSWLSTITSSDYAQFYFMTRAKQSTNLASLSSTNLMELPVLLPPACEQQEIAAFVERQSWGSDAMVNEAERAIALLRERRTALISAAVTGKIDVRGLAQPQAEAA